jgi:hypothetical protein
MPLSSATIQATLEGKLTAAGFDLSKGSGAILTKAIAETIYEELTMHAVVNTQGSAAAQTGTIS